jgi:2-polyprenyl-3-methyl-5-hydroxy-6-metoxy-1,4-benzoquinol methylase
MTTDDDLSDRYYLALGAAFARGRLPDVASSSPSDDRAAFRAAQSAGLKMHKFKRNAELPRVRRVLSMLAGLAPESLLDVGSGRGVFLWPLLDAFPSLPVTAIDREERRASDLAAVTRGGVARLTAKQMDATAVDFPDDTFDGVTQLEVLEHMPDPGKAAREAVRVARRFVIATVPSKPDDNPEHIHLFDGRALARLFEEAGARRVTVEHVLNHIVALALLS